MTVYTIKIPTEEEGLWDERLAFAEPATLVFTRMDAQWIVVEATMEDETSALILQAAFGGELAPLAAASPPSDGWETLPAKIGARFVMTEEPLETEAIVLSMEASEPVFDDRHPSTLSSLRLLVSLVDEDRLPNGFTCLDVGCGNGILGIAAGLLGGSRVEGFDLCPHAVSAATKNAAHYGLSGKSAWQEADLSDFRVGDRVDLVIANLFSDLLERSFDQLGTWVAPNGILLVSGILERFKDRVLEAAQRSGFSIEETRQRGPWVTAVLHISRNHGKRESPLLANG